MKSGEKLCMELVGEAASILLSSVPGSSIAVTTAKNGGRREDVSF